MFRSKKFLTAIGLMLLSVLIAACGSAEPQIVEKIVTQVVEVEVEKEVEVVVTQIVEVAGETVVQEVVVTEIVTEIEVQEVEVMVTATPAPVSFVDPSPDTYTAITFGDIDTMDPNLAYDTASGALIDAVMEPLITYNGADLTSYKPVLAMEIPTVDNGLISEDGTSYTFNIREGVMYHDGGTLEPHDVAYTFQRGLIQSDPNSAQWLFQEPVLGFDNCYDITEAIDPECNLAGDRDTLLAEATPEQLVAACELVQAAIVADDAAGTVTFNLAGPWGPFLATIAGTWGDIIDMEWAVAQGAWDGSCDTWQDYYAPGSENNELSTVINGTGPYTLENWTPGEGYTLQANPDYWGEQPAVQTYNLKQVDEWGTRFAALQAGDAESVAVPQANRPQVDAFVGEFCDYQTGECTPNADNPDGPLRKWGGLPSTSRTDAFMVFDIPSDSPYIGSGQLDGNGIPTDFFSDIHVRKAMAYCMDYDTYIAEGQNGEGVRNNGPIILGMLGYNPDGPMYEFDLEQCEAELAEAWGGVLPETGFRFQIAFNTGNTARQTVGAILQSNLRSINPDYQVDIVGLPWPTFLRSIRASQIPIFVSGWLEDIHDPHNWVQPFTVGTYAGRQNMDPDLRDAFGEFASAGVAASDPAEREAIYFDMQQFFYDNVPQVTLSQSTGVRYEQRWVDGWYYNPLFFPISAYSLDGGN